MSERNTALMPCLEVWRERGVEGRRVVGRRVEGNGYPLPYLVIFKIIGPFGLRGRKGE